MSDSTQKITQSGVCGKFGVSPPALYHYDDVAFYGVKEHKPIEHNLRDPINAHIDIETTPQYNVGSVGDPRLVIIDSVMGCRIEHPTPADVSHLTAHVEQVVSGKWVSNDRDQSQPQEEGSPAVNLDMSEPETSTDTKELTLAELAQLQTQEQAERQADPRTAAFNKKSLLENFIEHTKRRYLIKAGEPVAIPMQGVLAGDLVPVAPFRDYVALVDFNRADVTFQFYMENYGHLHRPVRNREELYFANLSRIQYGLYLERKGLVRLAEEGEVQRNDMDEVLRQSREKIKAGKAEKKKKK